MRHPRFRGRRGRGYSVGEKTLAQCLYPRLRADELLTADRGFYSWQAWDTTAATGAALLWRAPTQLGLPVVRVLSDGTYLTALGPGTTATESRNPASRPAPTTEHQPRSTSADSHNKQHDQLILRGIAPWPRPAYTCMAEEQYVFMTAQMGLQLLAITLAPLVAIMIPAVENGRQRARLAARAKIAGEVLNAAPKDSNIYPVLLAHFEACANLYLDAHQGPRRPQRSGRDRRYLWSAARYFASTAWFGSFAWIANSEPQSRPAWIMGGELGKVAWDPEAAQGLMIIAVTLLIIAFRKMWKYLRRRKYSPILFPMIDAIADYRSDSRTQSIDKGDLGRVHNQGSASGRGDAD